MTHKIKTIGIASADRSDMDGVCRVRLFSGRKPYNITDRDYWLLPEEKLEVVDGYDD